MGVLPQKTLCLQLKIMTVRRYRDRDDTTPRPKRSNTPLQRHSEYEEIYSQRLSCRLCRLYPQSVFCL